MRHKTCSRPSVQGRQRGVLCHNRRCPQSFVQDERGHVERNFPPCAIGRMRRQRSRVGYALRPERRAERPRAHGVGGARRRRSSRHRAAGRLRCGRAGSCSAPRRCGGPGRRRIRGDRRVPHRGNRADDSRSSMRPYSPSRSGPAAGRGERTSGGVSYRALYVKSVCSRGVFRPTPRRRVRRSRRRPRTVR